MKIRTFPRYFSLLSIIVVSSIHVENAGAQNTTNGLSRSLVYTYTETQTSVGRIRNFQTGATGFSSISVPSVGLLLIGPRRIENVQFFDYGAGTNSNVGLRIADTIQYTLFSESKSVMRQTATYTIGALNLGRSANPSQTRLVFNYYNKGSAFLGSSITSMNHQGQAILASPYPGLTAIWHALSLRRSNRLTESTISARPIGFARSLTDERRGVSDAFETTSDATFSFSRDLSELVKAETTFDGAKRAIENYLRSPAGGSYRIN